MRRFFVVCVLLVPIAGGLLARSSWAQDPADILDHYRLLPRYSTLHQSGGIGGFDQSYLLTGWYDLRHGTGWIAKASFENAEVWGSLISDGPTPAFVIDVDQILNLEGLHGEALPVAAPFDVYQFRGQTSDGSSVNLLGAVLGPWMVLRGTTQPPPNSADYFTYQIHALARSRPFADYNDNGVVDAADYVQFRNAANAGSVAIANYEDWAQQFGEAVSDLTAMDAMLSAALASSVPAAAVPEPALLSLVIVLSLILASRRVAKKGTRRTLKHAAR